MVMLESSIRTLPKKGNLAVLVMLGSLRGMIEEIACVMSKFLRKSRPCWDMTTVVKASCSCWICEEGISKRQVIRRKRGRVCAIFGLLISSLFLSFVLWGE